MQTLKNTKLGFFVLFSHIKPAPDKIVGDLKILFYTLSFFTTAL